MPPMRTDQPRINIRRAALIFVAGIITASCSEKPAPDREKDASEASRELVRESEVKTEELQPGEDRSGKIASLSSAPPRLFLLGQRAPIARDVLPEGPTCWPSAT